MEHNFKKVVFVCNGHDAVLVRWAISTLADAISKQGITTKVIDLAKGGDERECNNADFVVVYRTFDYRTTRLMRRVRASGGYVVYFLDDYLFQPNCRYTDGWTAPTDFLREADAFMSSSGKLLTKMISNKPKILRRSVLDDTATRMLIQGYRRNPDVFSIGWLAGKGRHGTMDLFVSHILSNLSAKMVDGERCQFHCFGNRMFPDFKNVDVTQHLFYKLEDWTGFYSKCVSLDFGVFINPLDELDEFCHCKSELKFVEAGTMGVPLVTSRIPPFIEVLEEGQTGLFASTPIEFAEKILKVMRDEAFARNISEKSKKLVATNYNAIENAKVFLDDVLKAMGNKESLYDKYKRV